MAEHNNPAPPLPAEKSTQEQLDELDEQLSSLEEKRKELLFEAAKEEAREDYDFLEEVHKDCPTQDTVEEAREEAEQEADAAWDWVQRFGSHDPTCLSGALVGTQDLHPLCTCGWNEVATALERA